MEFIKPHLSRFVEKVTARHLHIDFQGCNVHRLLVSFWNSVGFVGLGISLVIYGPTILDLANHINVSVVVITSMFTCRAVGGIIGGVSAGILLDKLVQYSYIIMTLIYISSIAVTIVIPLSVNVYMLAVCMFLHGIALGSLDSGTHAVLMRLWKEKSGPCMQVLHSAFAVGAFLAPLVAREFISTNDDRGYNYTEAINVTAQDDLPSSGCHNITNDTASDDPSNSHFEYAYWIASAFFVPTLLAYMFYAIKYDILRHCCRKRESSRWISTSMTVVNRGFGEDNEEDTEEEIEPDEFNERVHLPSLVISGDDEENDTNTQSIKPTIKPSQPLHIRNQTLVFKIILLSFLGLFMFLYVGLEVSFGTLIFTVVVTGPLNFSKPQGAVVQSLFWGTFAFTRLFSIVLAVFKVRSSVMLCGNLFGSVLAVTIMISFAHNDVAIWLGSAVLGMSYASFYPTVMTWMSETTDPTGRVTSILITGGSLGDIILPSAVGALIAQVSPDSLFYFNFVGIIVSALIFAFTFLIAYVQKKGMCGIFIKKEALVVTSGSDSVTGEESEGLIEGYEEDNEELIRREDILEEL